MGSDWSGSGRWLVQERLLAARYDTGYEAFLMSLAAGGFEKRR
jgi:hypothetical protein